MIEHNDLVLRSIKPNALYMTRHLQLKPRLHLPRSSYDFSVCDFLYDF